MALHNAISARRASFTEATLVKAQVWKYKSIEDTTPVDISSHVTVLVGKNESGETAFLEALHKARPLENACYDYIAAYPRKDLVRYRPQHEEKNYQKVVELTFRGGKALADKINSEVFGTADVVASGTTFTDSMVQRKPDQEARREGT